MKFEVNEMISYEKFWNRKVFNLEQVLGVIDLFTPDNEKTDKKIRK